MKKQFEILVFGVLAISAFCAVLQAEQRSRVGELRGTFVRLTEKRVGERTYLGLVIKPLEGRKNMTVLLSQRQEELVARGRRLREGQTVAVAYVTEAEHKWVRELEADRPRGTRGRSEEGLARRGTDSLWARFERLQDQVAELRGEVARLRDQLQENRGPKKEVKRVVRREGESDKRKARGERPKAEREVALHQLEVMRMAKPALKEANRTDAAELLTRAIRSREVVLEGRRDEEGLRIRERAPSRENLAEVLLLASRLWREFGHAEKSAAVGSVAEQMVGGKRRQAKERSERPDRALRATHITVRAAETGDPQIFFKEKRVSNEQLREILHDLKNDQLLHVHVRGAISEEWVQHITETAEDAGIKRIKVEHIRREKRAERDQSSVIHLFIEATEGGAKIYYKERPTSLEEIEERLQDIDRPHESVLELHVVKDVPERTVGRLIGMAREKGIERIHVTAWKKRQGKK
ncbi:MAG: hypothetical protein IIC50_01790 [Planctomycetes bacterium]|nr:hypothetical protein [Planctomycetota bacterium]